VKPKPGNHKPEKAAGGGFYKASRALLERTDLTPAEKLVRIVQAHYRTFEGRAATTKEMIQSLGGGKAKGLSRRTIFAALAGCREEAKSAVSAPKGVQNLHSGSAISAPGSAESAPPSCSTSYRSSEMKTKERDTDSLPLSATRGEEKEAKAATKDGPAVGVLALLHLKAVEGGGKWPLAKWIGHVEEDEAARRYTRAELAAFVADRTVVTEAPWRLADSVRRHADAARAAAFAARLRTIRAEGLTDARQEGAKRLKNTPQRARVTYVDPDAGEPLLVLAWTTPRIPGSSYGPQAGELRITDPTALAAWTFRARQPALPFAESQTGAKA